MAEKQDYAESCVHTGQAMHSADSFLFALQEIFQAVLYAGNSQEDQGEKKDPKLQVTIKQGDQRLISDSNILNTKVSCNQCVDLVQLMQAEEMPVLSSFICAMQKHTGKSHLAIQTSDCSASNEQKETSILWLEELETNTSQVKVTNKIVKPAREKDDCFVVIQIRALLDSSSLLKVSKDICSLMEMIKFLNPKMQLSFTLHYGNVVDLDLREESSIELGGIALCLKVFERKYGDYYEFEKCDIECSDVYTLTDDGQSETHLPSSSLTVKCIVLYIPMHRVNPQLANNSLLEMGKKNTTHGSVHLFFYGPGGCPLINSRFAKKLMDQQDSFLHLSSFGIQFKNTPAKLSKCGIEIRAEMHPKVDVSARSSDCQRFCQVFAYIIDLSDKNVGHKELLSVHRNISENLATMLDIDTLQKCTESAMLKMFGSTNPATASILDNSTDKIKVPSQLSSFEKMIPDIVDSLTDIFTRSTNLDFREQISSLIPTSSRAVMSDHLEKALRKTINAPSSDTTQVPAQLSAEIEESVDEWEESEDSMLSLSNFQALTTQSQCVNDTTGATFSNLPSHNFMNDCIETENTDSYNEENLNIEMLFREDIIKAENDLESWKLFAKTHEDSVESCSYFEQDTMLQNEYHADHEPNALCLDSSSQDAINPLCQGEQYIEPGNEESCGNDWRATDFTEDLLRFDGDDEFSNLDFPSHRIEQFAHSPPNDLGFTSHPMFRSQSPERESTECLNFGSDCAEESSFHDPLQPAELLKQESFTRKRSSEFLEFSDCRIESSVTTSDDMSFSQVPYKHSRIEHGGHCLAGTNLFDQPFAQSSNCSLGRYSIENTTSNTAEENYLTLSAIISTNIIQHGDHCLYGENLCDQSFTHCESSNCSLDMHNLQTRTSNTVYESSLTAPGINASNIMISPRRDYDEDNEWFDEEEIAIWRAEMES